MPFVGAVEHSGEPGAVYVLLSGGMRGSYPSSKVTILQILKKNVIQNLDFDVKKNNNIISNPNSTFKN